MASTFSRTSCTSRTSTKCFFRPLDAEPFAIKWAERRLDGPDVTTGSELEFMESFRPEGVDDVAFWKAMANPAILSFVLCLRDEDDLSEHCALCDAVRELLRRAGQTSLGAFEFKLWSVFWANTIGSDQNQIELYDTLQDCHRKGLIEFNEAEEWPRAPDLIRSIVFSTAHLEWEGLTGTPIFRGKAALDSPPSCDRYWFERLSSFAYAKGRKRPCHS
jgi:hypothetical protein